MKLTDIIFWLLLLVITAFTVWHASRSMFAVDYHGIVHAWYGVMGLVALVGLVLGRYL